MAQLLVDGQRVVPRRALASGFTFHHPDLREALTHLLAAAEREPQTELTAMYYNGECPVCNAEMTHYAALCANSQKSLQFINAMQSPEDFAAWGLRREHFERRVYLKDSQGRILSGLPALIELWSRMPQYRWLARLMKVPVVRPLSNAFYDHALAPALAAWARARSARHAREAPVTR
jgi:predicted DCC family thiol-disulfide oxidoreductase YuxK